MFFWVIAPITTSHFAPLISKEGIFLIDFGQPFRFFTNYPPPIPSYYTSDPRSIIFLSPERFRIPEYLTCGHQRTSFLRFMRENHSSTRFSAAKYLILEQTV